jgi:hypothetical protein
VGCIACGRDLHEECGNKPKDKPCCCVNLPGATGTVTGRLGQNYKADDEIGTSAGRKRAAVAHKIGEKDPNRHCEWRWKKNCGGGKKPIIGCIGGMQEHRHHGPVKNTARNETGNVHLICTSCHNRWHTLNDKIYNEEVYSTLPHKPLPATLEECYENEINWKAGRVS